jgi:molecular chaperone GrpE
MADHKDKEHEIPVKVIDRRWWANPEHPGSSEKPPSSSAKPTYVEELERQIADKDKQIQEYIAKYRQAAGEFEEARLRLRREVSKDIERGRREILADLLEVLDNLDRAIEATRTAASTDAVLQGVDMVRRQFLSKLEGFGVRPIDITPGSAFDPVLHEAVTAIPAANDAADGQIVGVVRRGYQIHDDVLRPAAVAVAKVVETRQT